MADSLVDLGIQDALRYVNVDIIPSIVTVARDVMMILVTSLTCVSGPPPEFSSTSTIRPDHLPLTRSQLPVVLRCSSRRGVPTVPIVAHGAHITPVIVFAPREVTPAMVDAN